MTESTTTTAEPAAGAETATMDEALERRDITIAFTPGQLVLIALGVWLLFRFLRGLRG